jgi:hypothetical protein
MRRLLPVAIALVAGCHAAGNQAMPDLDPNPGAIGGGPGSTGADGGSPDSGPPPAVPGGSIRTPPVCTASADVQLTSGGAVSSFAWAWDGTALVLVWSDAASGAGDIHAGRFTSDGTPVGPSVLLETTPAASALPTLARLGTGWVAAWEEGTAPSKAVRAQLLDDAAQPVGTGQTLIASTAEEVRPVVAAAPGGKAVLSWMTTTAGMPSVWLARLSTNLDLDSATRVAPSYGSGFPWLASDGQSLAMVYSDDRNGALSPRFAHLDDRLEPTLDDALRTAQTGDGKLSRMIGTANGYLAAWEDTRSGDEEIYLGAVDAAGNKLAESLVEEPGTGDANWPNLASNGTKAAIVYYQFRVDAPQIYLSFVDPQTGKRVSGGADVQVSHAPNGTWARYPDVAWTGSSFAVAWIDARSSTPQLYFSRVTCP